MFVDTLHPSLFFSPTPTDEIKNVPGTHSDIWFSDGNIILVAEDVSFKVHRGQLERQSQVFRDILAIPQPVDVWKVEDCHVIELHDSSSDVACLLKALYDGFYFKKPYANDFPAIEAVLRLSTKYFIDHLHERCIARLEIDWPTALSGWDMREAEATDHDGRYTPRASCPHPILVINLAREMGLTSILPAAFYDLCRYGPSKIAAGVPTDATAAADAPSAGARAQLSLHDLRVVLFGREAAQRATAAFIEEHISVRNVSGGCHNRDREAGRVCRESFYFIMLNVLRSVGGIASGRDSDPLFTLTQAVDMMSRSDFSDGTQLCSLKICAACKVDFERTVEVAREHIWTQIPGWFGM